MLFRSPLVVVEEKRLHDNAIYPSVNLLAAEGANANQNKFLQCIRIMREFSALASLVILLPDLIEVRVSW